jgi:outer membrane protein
MALRATKGAEDSRPAPSCREGERRYRLLTRAAPIGAVTVRERLFLWACLVACLFVPQAVAQNQPILIERPQLPLGIRSYVAPSIPEIRLENSNRLHGLIRAGHLYLSVQDALALAIENDLGLEIERYGPMLAQSALKRAEAGGPIRGVPSASAQVTSVNSGVGVNGATQSAGLSNNNGSSGNGGGNSTVQQIGTVTPQLDPFLQSTMVFGHLTQPQSNTVASQTNSLVESVRNYNTVLNQGLLTGGSLQFRDFEGYLKENSPSDILNPAVGPHMDITVVQPLLRGYGIKLNDRGIRIAQVNTTGSLEVFRGRLLDLVAGVLNQYWGFVSANDELQARRRALQFTQKFYEDTQKEIIGGSIPRVELPRAEAELAKRRQDVLIAEQSLSLQAISLKANLTRTPDPALDAAEIVALDQIQVPDQDDFPPLRQLVATAMAKRPDVAVSKFRDETAAMNLPGTTNPLLPNLTGAVQTYNRGVAGTPQAGQDANPYFVGGYGTALSQVFRRNFPNTIENLSFTASLKNRQAQADYGLDQLQFVQAQLSSQKDSNAIIVDISARLSALRQSRARYSVARDTRALQEQLLAADQKKFSSGIATFNDIITDQRALVTAQISEVTAAATYARARVSLDQTLGESLERNHITLNEGLDGRVARESQIPVIP